MLYLLLAAVLVAVDQIVKALVRLNIGLGEQLPFLPHVLGLTYAQNKYHATIQTANEANKFGYIIDNNIKRIQLYIRFIHKYDK